jgi:hypothetical protein
VLNGVEARICHPETANAILKPKRPPGWTIHRFSKFTTIGAVMLPPIAAQAGPIRIDFSGQVDDLTNFGSPGAFAIGAEISVGDAVSGTILFDPSAPATATTATQADYDAALIRFDISIGALSFSSLGGQFRVLDDYQPGAAAPLRDALLIDGIGVTGPLVGGVAPDLLQFSIGDDATGLLASTGMVGLAALNTLWAANTIVGDWNYVAFSNGDVARFSIASASFSAVPLPAALPLLVVGFGALALAGRRKAA